MHQQEHHRPKYTIEQAHLQLNRLAELINQPGNSSYQSLVAYVQIYVTMQSQSQEFFTSFCQHEIVQKVFSLEQINRDTLKILELFNLILANTNQLNNIIYLFSQPALHSFLFEHFNIQKQSSQAVEYYVQLLKTVIMKMSNGHSSLIKLFCNNRYSSFPMLYQLTYLAMNAHQELVKITAQQCVLLLINLLNKKKMGCSYLSQMQMAIFFYQLTLNVSHSQKDLEGGLKYVVDLLVSLQNNLISQTMLMNAFVLNIILKKINKISEVLAIVNRFSELMFECQQFPRSLYLHIRLVLSRIVCNFCFNKFINSTYITAFTKIVKNQNEIPSLLKDSIYSALMKYLATRFQKFLPYIQQFDKKQETQNDLGILLEGWILFTGSSQVNAIKQGKQKSRSSIFSFFNSKPTPLQNYLKAVTMSVGINYSALKYPVFKISITVDFSTAIYFVESVIVRQQVRLGSTRSGGFQNYQVHFNDNRVNFQLNEPFCSEILMMLSKIKKKSNSDQKQEQNLMEFEKNYIVRLKEYLSSSLGDHLLLIQHDYSTKQLSMLKKILKELKVSEALQRKIVQKLLWKLQQIQTQINQLTFKYDFKSLISYALSSQFETLLQKNKIKQHTQSDKIINKMFKYELIREIIDTQPHSLRNFILKKWKQYINTEPNSQKFTFHKTDKLGRLIKIKSNEQIRFTIQITEGENQNTSFDLQESISQGRYQQQSVYLSGYPEGIHFKSKEDCIEFKQQFLKITGLREQIITKWIVEFFEATHNRLCDVIAQKKQQKKLSKSSNFAHIH